MHMPHACAHVYKHGRMEDAACLHTCLYACLRTQVRGECCVTRNPTHAQQPTHVATHVTAHMPSHMSAPHRRAEDAARRAEQAARDAKRVQQPTEADESHARNYDVEAREAAAGMDMRIDMRAGIRPTRVKGHGKALVETVRRSAGMPVSMHWTCRRRCRYRAAWE